MDARAVAHEELEAFASILLELGCAYLCAWGPDCERVHDAMDNCVVGDSPPKSYKGCVMTTCHQEETLEEALEFFLCCTEPDLTFAPDGCKSAIAIAIGSTDWEKAIQQYLESHTIRKSAKPR